MSTPLKAIYQHCYTCIVDERHGNGTKREQTTRCTSHQCDLYKFRPITSAEKSRRNDEKLIGMSKAELEIYEANRAEKAIIFRQNVTKPKASNIGGK
jgi:hypothetical protein